MIIRNFGLTALNTHRQYEYIRFIPIITCKLLSVKAKTAPYLIYFCITSDTL